MIGKQYIYHIPKLKGKEVLAYFAKYDEIGTI